MGKWLEIFRALKNSGIDPLTDGDYRDTRARVLMAMATIDSLAAGDGR